MGTRARAVDETPAAPPRIRAHCGRATPSAPAATPVPPAGLAGEEAFRARLDEEFARAERHGRALAVVVFGVAAETIGDELFLDRFRASLRPGSLLAQLGDEELGLLVPEADGMDGYAAAERLRRAVNPPGAPYTALSAGVCDIEQALRARRPAAPRARGAASRRSPTAASASGATRPRSSQQCGESPLQNESLAGIRALARAIDHKDPSTDRPLRRRRRAWPARWRPSSAGRRRRSSGSSSRRWCTTSARWACPT